MKKLLIFLLLQFIPHIIIAQENPETRAVKDSIVEVLYPESLGTVSDFEDIFSETQMVELQSIILGSRKERGAK